MTSCVPCVLWSVPQVNMPRAKGIGMKKAKKTKVPAREEAMAAARGDGSVEEEAEEGEEPTPDLPAAPAPAPSPGRRKREQAEEELIELKAEWEVRQEVEGESAKALTLAERIYDAKMRRLDKSQAGKRHGDPTRELERVYRAELELLRARLAHEEAEATSHNAEANVLAQQCRVLRLENAKLQRTVRTLGGARARVR